MLKKDQSFIEYWLKFKEFDVVISLFTLGACVL